jgi:lysophospholipase L1-like esterase
MNTYIQAQATANGWAFLDLNGLLASKVIPSRGTYSVVKQLGCNTPYGQYVSLDGVHPNVVGYQEFANAAADALNATYGFEITKNPVTPLTYTQLCGP